MTRAVVYDDWPVELPGKARPGQERATLKDDPMVWKDFEWEQDLPGHCWACHVDSNDTPAACGPHCQREDIGDVSSSER